MGVKAFLAQPHTHQKRGLSTKMSLPRYLSVAASPGRAQVTFGQASSFGRRLSLRVHCLGAGILTAALWLTALEDFSAYPKHQLCWAHYFFEIMVTLHFMWCECFCLHSQEIHLENLVQARHHARALLARSVAQVIHILAWKLYEPMAMWEVNVRIWCDLIHFGEKKKRGQKSAKPTLPAGEMKATPKYVAFCVSGALLSVKKRHFNPKSLKGECRWAVTISVQSD